MNNINPFVGLRAFKEDESINYCGYEEIAIQLRKAVSENNISLLTAPSGIGKSSFVNAEFIPVLQDFTPIDYPIKWFFQKIEPGEKPVIKLLKSFNFSDEDIFVINDKLINGSNDFRKKDKIFIDIWFKVSRNLSRNFGLTEEKESNLTPKLLLIIDQFEEIFTESNETDRNNFINILLKISRHENLSIVLVGRVDYLINLNAYNSLIEEINDCIIFLPAIPEQSLISYIRKPTIDGAIVFEEQLQALFIEKIRHIRKSVDKESSSTQTIEDDSLSLLQYYLFQMWNKYGCDNKVFTTENYLNTGPLEKVVDSFCDDVY